MVTKGRSNPPREGAPTSMPEGTPSLASPMDHSFTLQAVMDLQKSVATLSTKIDRMSDDVAGFGSRLDTFGEKLDKVRTWQSVVSGGAIVVAAVVAIIWSVITFVPWDRIHFDTTPHAEKNATKS